MTVLKVLEVIFPVFSLAALGFLWVRLGFEYPIKFVTRLSTMIAVPCLVFVSLMGTTIKTENIIILGTATFSTYFIVMLIFFCFIRFRNMNSQTYLAPLVFGNTGNIGLPLAYLSFGDVGLDYAVIIFSITAILSFSIGIWFVSANPISLKILKSEPLLVATILGAIFLLTGWSTPQFLTSTLDLFAQMAIPLMLITLGVAVASLEAKDLKNALTLSILKFLICILSGIVVGHLFSLDKISFWILLLQISTPVAVTSYLLASKYRADATTVAGLVIVSTCLSLVLIPAIFFIQLHYFP